MPSPLASAPLPQLALLALLFFCCTQAATTPVCFVGYVCTCDVKCEASKVRTFTTKCRKPSIYVCLSHALPWYVVDSYCIDRGTLLDDPSVVTLQNPAAHSIHCLVDVAACRASGYELLSPPAAGSNTYCRAFTLDEAGNDLVVDYARSVGECHSCSGAGSQKADFQVTVTGTVSSDAATTTKPLLSVTSVQSASVGCPSGASVPSPESLDCTGGRYQPYQYVHGSLMMVSWGLLLPLGVISARFLKYQGGEPPVWFMYHRPLQISGLLLAIVGWIVALTQFDVFRAGGGTSFVHGVLGMLVMTLGILQPIGAYFRPHAAHAGEAPTRARRLFELAHKGGGYSAVTLAVFTILLGVTRPSIPMAKTVFAILYALIICSLGYLVWYLKTDARAKEAAASAATLASLG
eukprot:GSChrysophyteH2.ASY1.ANO1.230.1 assembled CDS